VIIRVLLLVDLIAYCIILVDRKEKIVFASLLLSWKNEIREHFSLLIPAKIYFSGYYQRRRIGEKWEIKRIKTPKRKNLRKLQKVISPICKLQTRTLKNSEKPQRIGPLLIKISGKSCAAKPKGYETEVEKPQKRGRKKGSQSDNEEQSINNCVEKAIHNAQIQLSQNFSRNPSNPISLHQSERLDINAAVPSTSQTPTHTIVPTQRRYNTRSKSLNPPQVPHKPVTKFESQQKANLNSSITKLKNHAYILHLNDNGVEASAEDGDTSTEEELSGDEKHQPDQQYRNPEEPGEHPEAPGNGPRTPPQDPPRQQRPTSRSTKATPYTTSKPTKAAETLYPTSRSTKATPYTTSRPTKASPYTTSRPTKAAATPYTTSRTTKAADEPRWRWKWRFLSK
jgi:hypothetical protein